MQTTTRDATATQQRMLISSSTPARVIQKQRCCLVEFIQKNFYGNGSLLWVTDTSLLQKVPKITKILMSVVCVLCYNKPYMTIYNLFTNFVQAQHPHHNILLADSHTSVFLENCQFIQVASLYTQAPILQYYCAHSVLQDDLLNTFKPYMVQTSQQHTTSGTLYT